MGRELIIRSDEACAIADALAQRLDVSATEVVEAALRSYRASMEPTHTAEAPVQLMLPEERAAFIEEVLALGRRARADLDGRPVPNVDELLYDERGLPR